MSTRRKWTRQELLIAFGLYCQIPFGRFHSNNPEIIRISSLMKRTPSALAMKLSNIASLDPAFRASGHKGLEGASFADREMWAEMEADWESFAVLSENTLQTFLENTQSRIPEDQEEVKQDYTGKDKVVTSKTRVGQSFFRKAVLSAYRNKCCISGLTVPQLLVASHIVPWRMDEANRLNPRNGLSLSMLHDKAFDIGMITLDEEMCVQVSKQAIHRNDDFFQETLQHFDGKSIQFPEKFAPDESFLKTHRETIFLG